jgi:hypothetical protein
MLCDMGVKLRVSNWGKEGEGVTNGVLKEVYGPKGLGETVEWWKLRNEELCDWCSSLNNTRIVQDCKNKDDEVDGACGMCRGEEKYVQCFCGDTCKKGSLLNRFSAQRIPPVMITSLYSVAWLGAADGSVGVDFICLLYFRCLALVNVRILVSRNAMSSSFVCRVTSLSPEAVIMTFCQS